jgi:hypothetical protein
MRDTWLPERCEELVGGPLRVFDADVPPTLRTSMWRDAEDGSVVLHLVNYGAPGPTPPDGRVGPVDNVSRAS